MLHEYSSDHSSQFLQRVAVFRLEFDVRYQQVKIKFFLASCHPDIALLAISHDHECR